MKVFPLGGFRLTSLLLVALSLDSPGSDARAAQPRRTTGKILVQPREGVSPNQLEVWSGRHGLDTLKVHRGFGNLHVMRLRGLGEEEVISRLQKSGLVQYAEPDYILTASVVPNDPEIADGTAWALSKISLPAAWEGGTLAANIIVAIVDSGVRATHEDLRGNLWTNPNEIADNGVDDDNDGFIDDVHGLNALNDSGDIADDDGHGTHVAGIIGAMGNNGKGSAGVVWNVQLMPLKFLDSNGEGSTSDAIACIDYARVHGASIINASWGGGDFSQSLRSAISRAQNDGIIFVAAAGNEDLNLDREGSFPAAFSLDNIVAVGASDQNDALAGFSNYGASSVDLLAPGEGIYSTWFTGDSAYVSMDGTSMATPFVTGAFALLKAHFPEKSYSELIDAVLKSVDKVPAAAGRTVSGGRLNVAAALNYLSPASAPTIALSESENNLTISVTGEAGRVVEIQQSSDLQSWNPVSSVQLEADGHGSIFVTKYLDPMVVFRALQQ